MTTPNDPGQPPGPPGQPPPGYGPPPPGYGPPAAQPSNTPMVLGILGIVFALCCWPIGLVLGILSYTQAKKVPGGNTTIGTVAIALSVVFGLLNIILVATGHSVFYYRNT